MGKVSDWVCYSKCVNFIMRVKDMKLWVWMHKNLSVKVWEQAYDSLSIRLKLWWLRCENIDMRVYHYSLGVGLGIEIRRTWIKI